LFLHVTIVKETTGTPGCGVVSERSMWRSMAISFTVQALAVIAGVIISILTVDKLGAIALPQPMPPYPREPKPVKIIAVHRGSLGSNVSFPRTAVKPFVEPTAIPSRVAMIKDGPEMMLAQGPMVSMSGPGGIQGIDPSLGAGLLLVTGAPQAPPAPKKDPPKETRPVRVGGNVMEAKLVKRVMPVYPPLARQARVSGTVRLEGVISRDGRIVNLQVHGGHPLLIAAAVEAVRQWVYRPTLLNGEVVEVIAPIEVHFTLSQ
jgi:protein TonB